MSHCFPPVRHEILYSLLIVGLQWIVANVVLREVVPMVFPGGVSSAKVVGLVVVLLSSLISLPLLCQTVPPQAVPNAVPELVVESNPDFSGWTLPIIRNPLQADPRLIAAFMRPWLLSGRFLSFNEDAKSTRSLPQAKSYKLTPDPFNWSAISDSPDSDNFVYLPELPRPGHPNTAQRMAAEPPHHVPAAMPAKYDTAQIGNRPVGQGINFFSIEKEIALGRELSAQVEQSTRLLTDAEITEYVNRKAQLLVQHSDCKVPFVVKIVDDDEVNAFALPGGFFYVNTGLILAADDEAELASVMAHEIAHVCARHATKNLTRGEISQYISLPLIFLGGPVGLAVRQISSFAMPLSFLKFSRDAEREADLLGMQYQYAAGYDPTAFVDFFEKLEGEEKEPHNFVARAFMTHPMTDDRVRRAEHMLENLPDRDSYITDTSEFDQVRDRLSKLTRGRALNGGKRPHPTLRRRTGTQ